MDRVISIHLNSDWQPTEELRFRLQSGYYQHTSPHAQLITHWRSPQITNIEQRDCLRCNDGVLLVAAIHSMRCGLDVYMYIAAIAP